MNQKYKYLLLGFGVFLLGGIANFFFVPVARQLGDDDQVADMQINLKEKNALKAIDSQLAVSEDEVRRIFRNVGANSSGSIGSKEQQNSLITEVPEWSLVGVVAVSQKKTAFLRSPEGLTVAVSVGDVFGNGNKVDKIERKALYYTLTNGKREHLGLYKKVETK